MRLKVISCQVFCREIAAVSKPCAHELDVAFLSKGLHNLGCAGMRERIQQAVDGVSSGYDAVLIGYGLCSNGLAGLEARAIPLVIPRAHDCITVLLGSSPKYLDYFAHNPGVYFQSTGWIEHRKNPEELDQLSIARRHDLDAGFEELAARFGEDNARYLIGELGDHTRHYQKLTFIEMGVEPHDGFESEARAEAARRGWTFENVAGDLSLLQRFVDADWGEAEFLIVPPGQRVMASFDEKVISVEPARNAAC